jgi:energy-converting hydrogenase Eha subunit G
MGSLAVKALFYSITNSFKQNDWEGATRINKIGWIIFIRFATCVTACG